MSIGSNIKKYRKKKKLTQGELGKLLGVGTSAVSSWEIGKNKPLMDNIQKMSEIFETSVSDLLEISSSTSNNTLKNILIPLYEDLTTVISDSSNNNYNAIKYISIPHVLINKYSNHSNLFGTQLSDDSMNKYINEKELVIIKPNETYKDGDIVIFSYDGKCSIRRYMPNNIEGFIIFAAESENPNFKNIAIPSDSINETKIYGKVIYYGTTL